MGSWLQGFSYRPFSFGEPSTNVVDAFCGLLAYVVGLLVKINLRFAAPTSSRASPIRLALEALEPRCVPATVTWQGVLGGAGQPPTWENPLCWDVGHVPNVDDTVFINGGQICPPIVNANHTIRDLFMMPNCGGIWGPGDLTVSNDFQWHDGSLNGTGRMTLLGTATISLLAGQAPSEKHLNRNLDNAGTFSWLDGNIIMSGVTIKNMSGATFYMNSADGTLSPDVGTERFRNEGTVTKSNGTTTVDCLFDNYGTVNGTNGILRLQNDGQYAGVFSTASGAVILFAGTGLTVHTAYTGTFFEGQGWERMTSGEKLTIPPGNRVINHGNFEMRSTRCVMEGSVTGLFWNQQPGLFLWTGGTIQNCTVTNGATMRVDDPNDSYTRQMKDSLLNNGRDATFEWTNGDFSLFATPGSATRRCDIDNLGTFEAKADNTMFANDPAQCAFVNGILISANVQGLFKKTGSAGGATTIQALFDNSGIIDRMGFAVNFIGGLARHPGDVLR